jgi:TonB family protein
VSKQSVRLIYIILILILIVPAGQAFSQSNAANKRKDRLHSKPVATKVKSGRVRTISLGVINGRAVDLVKPKYPEIARAVNVYGRVEIAVTIDEDGKVISATVPKGHPFLRSAALRAASESVFQPFPSRVNGIIDYHFRLNQWNWLEIGFALKGKSIYYSTRDLRSQWPEGFNDESDLLDPTNQSVDNWEQSLETAAALIRNKLSNDQRSSWLFETGVRLAKIKSICCRVDDEMVSLANDLRNSLRSAPPNTSSALLKGLQRIISVVENGHRRASEPLFETQTPLYNLLIAMEDKFPFTGR